MRLIYDVNHEPIIGRYKNVIVEDNATGKFFFYDSQGTWAITNTLSDIDEANFVTKADLPINVKDFGAKGDGVTDDLPAFQAALLAGNHVVVPPGVYAFSNTLKIPNEKQLSGTAANGASASEGLTYSCKIKYIGTTSRHKAVIVLGPNNVDAEPSSKARNIYLTNIQVDANYKAGFGVYGTGLTDNTTIDDVTVVNALEYGFYIASAWYSRFYRLYAYNCPGNGVAFGMPLRYMDDTLITWITPAAIEMNACPIRDIRAYYNGSYFWFEHPNTYDPTSANFNKGYGIGVGIGFDIMLDNFTAEKSGGCGLYVYTPGASINKSITNGYIEGNSLNSGLSNATAAANVIIHDTNYTNGKVELSNIYINETIGGGIYHKGILRRSTLHNVNTTPFIKSLDGISDEAILKNFLIEQVEGFRDTISLDHINKDGLTIYNTTDHDTNYERYKFFWEDDVFNIASQIAGTGASRSLRLRVYTTNGLIINENFTSQGHIQALLNSWLAGSIINSVNGTMSATSGRQYGQQIKPTIIQTGTSATTVSLTNAIITSSGSGGVLLQDLQTNGVSKYSIDSNGLVTASNRITNVTNPTAAQDVATKNYVDTANGLKANDNAVVHLGGAETITGKKSFSSTSSGIEFNNTSDPVNFERYHHYWSGDTYIIGNEIGGTGVSRDMQLKIYTSGGLILNQNFTSQGHIQSKLDSGVSGSIINSVNGLMTTTTGRQYGQQIKLTGSQTATAGYTAQLISINETSVGSAISYLAYYEVNGASKFNVDTTGLITASNRITNVTNPTSAQDAATKNYVDTADALKATDSLVVHLAGTETITGAKTFSSSLIIDTNTFTVDATNHRIGILTTSPTHTVTFGSTSTGEVFYNTPSQTTNYERYRQMWSADTFYIYGEISGTGVTRPMALTPFGLSTTLGLFINAASASGIVEARMASGTAGATALKVSGVQSAASGIQYGQSIAHTINQSSTAGYTALDINVTETSLGSGLKLLQDWRVGGISKVSIKNNGVFMPVQAVTASAPDYVVGGVYFDTTLNKLRVGGASGWETVTSA